MKLYTINATPVRYDLDTGVNNERCNEYPKMVSKLLAKYGIDGFTIYKVDGYWQGQAEQSFKIELATGLPKNVINTICAALRDTYNQDAVMLTSPNNSVEFI